MKALTNIRRCTGTPETSTVRPRFRRFLAPLFLLSVATFLIAAACSSGSEEAAMFDEQGKPMDDGDAPAATTAAAIDSGDLAPDFELTLFNTELHEAGEILRLSDLKGQPVVINFWFPSCPPCRAEMPDLEKVFQAHRKDGVHFVGVQLLGLDSAQDGQEFVEEVGVNFAIGPDEDGSIIRKYEIPGFPSTVFVDRDFKIVREYTGGLNEEILEELVSRILK